MKYKFSKEELYHLEFVIGNCYTGFKCSSPVYRKLNPLIDGKSRYITSATFEALETIDREVERFL